MSTWFEPSVWAPLRALLAAIQHSPIVARPLARVPVAAFADWASIRKSGNADAYVLAWLAREARHARRSRVLM